MFDIEMNLLRCVWLCFLFLVVVIFLRIFWSFLKNILNFVFGFFGLVCFRFVIKFVWFNEMRCKCFCIIGLVVWLLLNVNFLYMYFIIDGDKEVILLIFFLNVFFIFWVWNFWIFDFVVCNNLVFWINICDFVWFCSVL